MQDRGDQEGSVKPGVAEAPSTCNGRPGGESSAVMFSQEHKVREDEGPPLLSQAMLHLTEPGMSSRP